MARIDAPGVTNVQPPGGTPGGAGPEGEHALVGPLHTAVGLTVGMVPIATGPTTFAWALLALSALPDDLTTATELAAAFGAHVGASDPHGQYILETEKGAAGGVAPLNGSGDLDPGYLPAASETAAGVVELATDGEEAAGLAVQGDDGRLSDSREPTLHAADHKHGGGDEIATDVPGANAIPKAGADGTLAAGWLPATMATEAEVAAAISAHAGAADPHAGYQKESERGAASGYAPLDGASKVPGANLPAASESAAGIVELATGAEGGAGLAIQANDPRLTDAREPTAHAGEHEPLGADPMAVDAAAGTGSLRTLGSGGTQAAPGNHGHPYIPTAEKGAPSGVATLDAGGTIPDSQIPAGISRDTEVAAAIDAEMDPSTGHDHDGVDSKAVAWGSISGKPATFPPEGHHGGHENGGGDEISIAGLSGVAADPQTPADHAAEHGPAGGDPLKLDDLAVPDDNTDLNATTTRHGLLPKLTGSTAQFLRGDGQYANPPGGGGAVWGAITGTLGDQADLDAALDAKATPADISAAITAHEGEADPHPGYLTPVEGAAAFDALGAASAAVGAHEAAGDPHPGYATDGDLSAHTGAASPHSGHVQIGGQLSGAAATPKVSGLRETGGPTDLAMGAVADGQYLKRSGATVVGDTPAGGGGADPTDPTTAQVLVDDFMTGSTETGEVGVLGWTFTNGSIVVPGAVIQNHPGLITRRSGTTASQVASLHPNATVAMVSQRFDEFDVETWIAALVTTGSDFSVRFGIGDNASSNPPTHGVYIERLNGDTSFFGVARNGGAQTRTAALLAQDTAYHKFRIRRISATEVGFTVDAGAEVVITASNIPDAADAVKSFHQIIPTTTTARDHTLDFFSHKNLAVAR